MRTLLIFIFLLGTQLSAADNIPAIKDAFQSLSKMKKYDADTFDDAADTLLMHRLEALKWYETKKPPYEDATEYGKFTLQRMHDMLLWPLDVKGIVVQNYYNSENIKRGSLKPHMILCTLNGKAIPSEDDYVGMVKDSNKKKVGNMLYEGFYEGIPVSAKTVQAWSGYYTTDYPDTFAKYVHSAERDPAYDALVKRGLLENRLQNDDVYPGILEQALAKGCKDPSILFIVLRGHYATSNPEKVIRAWETYNGKVVFSEDHDRPFKSLCLTEYAMALIKTDKIEEGAALMKKQLPILKEAQEVTYAQYAMKSLGILLFGKDDEQAKKYLQEAIDIVNTKSWNYRNNIYEMIRHLKLTNKSRDAIKLYGKLKTNDRDSKSIDSSLRDNDKCRHGTYQIVSNQFLFSDKEALELDPNLGNGLKCEYYKDTEFKELVFTRNHGEVDFNWRNRSPLPGRIPVDNFSQRWTGFLMPPSTGKFRIMIKATDGVRLWINDEQLVDSWAETEKPAQHKVTVQLNAYEPVPIKIDYYHGTGNMFLVMYWIEPESPEKRKVNWSLACRYNFDHEASIAPLLYYGMRDYPHLAPRPSGDGQLEFDNSRTGTYHSGFNYYNNEHKVSCDFTLKKAYEHNNWAQSTYGISALFTNKHRSESGLVLSYPEGCRIYHTFSRITLRYFLPRISLRKTNNISLSVIGRRCEQRVNDNLVDIQYMPTWWRGRWIIRYMMANFTFDNLEVYVRSKEQVDNEELRSLYDAAAQDMNKGNLAPALEKLELIASKQVRADELARIYAAYIYTHRKLLEDGLKVLAERCKLVTTRTQLDMLCQAEYHLHAESMTNIELFDELMGLHISTNEDSWRTDEIPDNMKYFDEPKNVALILGGLGAHEINAWIKKKPYEEVYRKLNEKLKSLPDSALLRWELYRRCKERYIMDLVESLEAELRVMFPKVEKF